MVCSVKLLRSVTIVQLAYSEVPGVPYSPNWKFLSNQLGYHSGPRGTISVASYLHIPTLS